MSGTTENFLFGRTYTAASALSKYAVVVYGTEARQVKAPAAALDGGIAGVTQDAASASGDTILVMKEGISKAIASEAISVGIEVGISDVEGRVSDPAVWASGDGVLGVAETAATASGDIFECWLQVRKELG